MDIIKATEKDFDIIYKIMEEAFPEEERREKEKQRNLFNERIYNVFFNEEKTVFIAAWELEEYIYIEHFASAKSQRGNGIGSKFLKEFIRQINKAVVLEVEPPLNEIAKRRIMFYEREGFILNDYFYIQPSLGNGRKEIELKIMTYPNMISENDFSRLKNEIYKKVYRLN